MARRSREDEPGAFLHVFNRGLSKRTIFENRSDVRYFLSRLAREHRRGRLFTHAYELLANHFHLLVESPTGEASEAMRVIQNEYVRWFNRRRRRDGPLFRGRFGSRRVRSERYWWVLLRYMDMNSVKARLSASEGVYPYGSAIHYLQAEGPRWLTRVRVEDLLMGGGDSSVYAPSMYERLLARPLSIAERELVEARMRGTRGEADPLDELLNAGPARVRRWMLEKAKSADGTTPGLALASPTYLLDIIAERRLLDPDCKVKVGRRARDAWDLISTALLRELCALSLASVAARQGVGVSTVQARTEVHRKLLAADPDYCRLTAELADRCLDPFRGGIEH
jgi:REP element-mobilizing transposase RayT